MNPMKKKLLTASVLAVVSTQAGAFQLDTGDDWDIRWDNTVKFNVMSRVAKQDKDVYVGRKGNTAFQLADDSDLSVDRSDGGLVSTRFDLLSEMDVIFKRNFGFRVSAAGWYDPMYGDDSDHPKDRRFTWASPSVDYGEYTDKAEDWHYLGGELLDAFVFANFDIGPLAGNIRAGRHTIYWGQSLLGTGATHGVASAMAPLDFSKALAVPGSEAKELFLPTNKISTVWQLTENLTFNAFYNLEHQEYRFPETGTYFSPAEGLEDDAEFITIAPVDPTDPTNPLRVGLTVEDDETDDGDWGVNFQYYVEPLSLETSFIYINYVNKIQEGLVGGVDFGQFALVQAQGGDPAFQQIVGAWQAGCADGSFACPTPPDIDPETGTIGVGRAKWLYKDDVDLYAITFAKEIAGISVGMDIVTRRNAPLPPELGVALVTGAFTNIPEQLQPLLAPAGIVNTDFDGADSSNYTRTVGDTWHLVINGLGLLSDNGFWEGGNYIVEATFSMLEDCSENCEYLDHRIKEDRVVSNIGIVFKPTWFQVWPGTDLSVPFTLSYTIDGEKAPIGFGGDEENGNASLGLEFDINQTWLATLKYNNFFGPVAAGLGGLLKDRDNVSFTVKRTF
jgi:hypothetical protein